MRSKMKTSTLILTLFLVITTQLNSQIFEENFDYSLGVLEEVTSNWIQTTTSVDVDVITGNLTYPSYISSDIGNMIFLDGGSDSRTDIQRSFNLITNGQVYISFLIKFLDNDDLDVNSGEGDNFFKMRVALSGSTYRNYLYVKNGVQPNTINIGLAKASAASLEYLLTDFNISDTYLIVLSYEFIDGNNNDIVKLWINPSLDGGEPTPDLSITSGSDADSFEAVQFIQDALSGNFNIDGIRVSTSWSTAPLPVELTSFTANQESNGINLQWETSNEINNYGFDIERSVESSNEFQKIGFINGHGNSNSPKSYSFLDDKFTEIFKNQESSKGEIQYRLKHIDFDGNYEYSKIITVETLHATFLPSKFELLQNYPNPFNPVTTIKYSIPSVETRRGVSVILKIYDILGNEIATLVNEQKQAGEYEVNFNASNLAGGIYLYRLQTSSGVVLTKKLILLK